MKTLFNFSLLFFILIIPRCQDASVSNEITSQLNKPSESLGLVYPKSVKRFFAEKKFEPLWVEDSLRSSKTWQSMLLLDCVLQYGLSHDDYHPDELLYPKLREIMKNPEKVAVKEKARLEMVLTDALITLINDLHFGKANPVYTRAKIDIGNLDGFSAEAVLSKALMANDFMATILDVQPKTQAYTNLQNHMKLVRGQYLDDCYEVPEAEVRKVAINMERLKWGDIHAKTFIEVNIPAYTLTLNLPDTSFEFKVIVGKQQTPTPTLTSTINYLATAPDWKVPNDMFLNNILPKAMANISFLENNHYFIYNQNGELLDVDALKLAKIKKAPKGYWAVQSAACATTLGRVVFHFPNKEGIYLHDGQDDKLFNFVDRAFNAGCISIQQAEKLAAILIKNDGQAPMVNEMKAAIAAYRTKNFIFKQPIPLNIVYQTCAVKEGQLLSYNDIYQKDAELEKTMYPQNKILAKIKLIKKR